MSKSIPQQLQSPQNNPRRSFLGLLLFAIAPWAWPRSAAAQPPGRGPGRRGGFGGGRGQNDPDWQADHETIHTLLSQRNQIRREVKMLPNGVQTLTETDDPKLRAVLLNHVLAMKKRVEDVRPIHMRDPLFAALFRSAGKISMEVKESGQGVQVTETSDDAFAVKLIQAHAAVVSLFIKNGHREVQKNHRVPK